MIPNQTQKRWTLVLKDTWQPSSLCEMGVDEFVGLKVFKWVGSELWTTMWCLCEENPEVETQTTILLGGLVSNNKQTNWYFECDSYVLPQTLVLMKMMAYTSHHAVLKRAGQLSARLPSFKSPIPKKKLGTELKWQKLLWDMVQGRFVLNFSIHRFVVYCGVTSSSFSTPFCQQSL